MRFLVVVSLVLTLNAFSQIPRTISFQGILADALGNLVPDGNHQLQLTLSDQASGGNQVFVENQTVPVVDELKSISSSVMYSVQ